MRFSIDLKKRDFEEAERLHRSLKFSRRVQFLLLFRVVPVASAIGLVLLNAYDIKVQLQTAGMLLGLGIALLWFGVLLVLLPSTQIQNRAKRAVSSDSIVMALDDSAVLIQIPGKRETKMFWQGFTSFAKNEEISLLYYSKDCFVLIPTRAMPGEEKAELYAIINSNLESKLC